MTDDELTEEQKAECVDMLHAYIGASKRVHEVETASNYRDATAEERSELDLYCLAKTFAIFIVGMTGQPVERAVKITGGDQFARHSAVFCGLAQKVMDGKLDFAPEVSSEEEKPRHDH